MCIRDRVNIKLAAPVRVTGVDSSRGFRIIPFIQLDWAGNTRSEIRRYACLLYTSEQAAFVGRVFKGAPSARQHAQDEEAQRLSLIHI